MEKLLKSSEGKVLHCPACPKELEYSEINDDDYTLNNDSGVCDGPIANITCGGCGFTINVNLEFYGVYW